MKAFFDHLSRKISKKVTCAYSTSFSLGIKMLHPSLRDDIFAIYGFVRFADEIVDSFHDYDKRALLKDFEQQTFQAIAQGISLNPILNSFQETVNTYQIDHKLIEQFLHSMYMDLDPQSYDQNKYEEYILGSAQVVGLMTLKVFCKGDEEQYRALSPGAMSLGAAFQKVNFLRDIHADQDNLGRTYFPNWDENGFTDQVKQEIEEDIAEDFRNARIAINKLPKEAKFGVYSAYVYYKALFLKIKRERPQALYQQRIRIPNGLKLGLLVFAKMNIKLNRV